MVAVLVCIGSGIGTGPGVIQDHYSPTMGRHRTNPLYNGHNGNSTGSHPAQFEGGNKQFIKPSQVNISTLYFFSVLCNQEFCEEDVIPHKLNISLFFCKGAEFTRFQPQTESRCADAV